jgi:purine-binding chemotaxis protein CheW
MAEPPIDSRTAAGRFLTFRSEGRFYALPAGLIAEVIRMPVIARVPQGPRSLLGLANLRGSVLPVASVRSLLGRSETAGTSAARLIVLDGASRVALAVDEVTALVNVEESKVNRAEAEISAESGELLQGVFQVDDRVTKILDIDLLLRRAFELGGSRRQATVATAPIVESHVIVDTQQRLVTFDVAGQEYALKLDVVREIVTVPDHLTFVPGSDDAVRGVMAYREGILPLLSLRSLLGLSRTEAVRSREKVMITAVGDVLVGLVADRTRAVLAVDPDRIEPTPRVLSARAGGETQIKEIYRADRDRLISILAPEQLFREDIMQRLGQGGGSMESNPIGAPQGAQSSDLQFLVFRLGDNEFALPIDAVEEVARVPDQITRLPKAPKFLEGVVNLRGEVLPVVDQRQRFEMPVREGSIDRRLVVVRTERHRAGLIVDSVSEVLRCTTQAIKPAPDLTGDALALVRSVINLEAKGRIVLLLDPSELLSRTEKGLLDSFSKDLRD